MGMGMEWGRERWGDKRRALCNSVKITECSASYIKERFSLFFLTGFGEFAGVGAS